MTEDTEAPKETQAQLSRTELTQLCLNRTPISKNTRLCPGVFMEEADRSIQGGVYAKYGIELVHNNEVIGKMGFNLEDEHYTDPDTMIIPHTPQGRRPQDISRESRRRLLSTKENFREKLFKDAISIAERLGVKQVVVLSAENIFFGHTYPQKAKMVVDYLAKSFGAQYDKRRNLVINLSTGNNKGL